MRKPRTVETTRTYGDVTIHSHQAVRITGAPGEWVATQLHANGVRVVALPLAEASTAMWLTATDIRVNVTPLTAPDGTPVFAW